MKKNNRCIVDLLLRSEALKTEAGRLGIKPANQKTLKDTTDRRRRAVKERIASRRDGATRLLMSRRAESRQSLATALEHVRRSRPKKANNDAITNAHPDSALCA